MNLMSLFNGTDTVSVSLSGKEIAILDAVHQLGSVGICAADLQAALAAANSKNPRVATVYSAILGLERKGLLSVVSSSLPEKGGRPRRLFAMTERGRLAHQLGAAIASDNDARPLALT